MVGGDDDQEVWVSGAVGLDRPHDPVEHVGGLDHQAGVACVSADVDLVDVDGEKEAVRVLAEDLDRLRDERLLGNVVRVLLAGVVGKELADVRGLLDEPEHLRPGQRRDALGVGGVLVAELLRLGDQVDLPAALVSRKEVRDLALAPPRIPVLLAAAENHVGLGVVEEAAGDLAALVAILDVCREGAGGCVGDVAVLDEAGRLAGVAGDLEQRRETLSVRADTDVAVVGLDAGGDRRGAGCGVGDRVRALRHHRTRDRQRIHGLGGLEPVASELGGGALGRAHAVSDQNDDAGPRGDRGIAGGTATSEKKRRGEGDGHSCGDHCSDAAMLKRHPRLHDCSTVQRLGRRLTYCGTILGVPVRVALCALVAVLVTAGCGGGSGTSEPAPPPVDPDAAVSGTLLTFTYSDAASDVILDPFRKQNPDLEVKTATFDSVQEGAAKLAGGFEADVVHVCSDEYQPLVTRGLLRPIDPDAIEGWDQLSFRDNEGVSNADGTVNFVPVAAAPRACFTTPRRSPRRPTRGPTSSTRSTPGGFRWTVAPG